MKEEIRLRDLIFLIVTNLKAVLLVTFLIMLIAALYLIFLIKPTYRTESLVIVNQMNEDQNTKSRDLSPLAEQVRSDSGLSKIINYLKLDSNKYSINTIRQALSITTEKDAGLISITAKGENPEFAKNLANTVAIEIGKNIEISDRMDLIVSYNKQTLELQDKIKMEESQIQEANQLLQTTPEKLVTKKSLLDDPMLYSIVNNMKNQKTDQSFEMTSEEVNTVFLEIKTKAAEASLELSKLQAQLKSLTDKMVENQKFINEIDKNSSTEENIQKINTNYKAVIFNPAIAPREPISVNKKLIVILSGFFTFIFSITFVFLKEFWKKELIS
ncbi:Wzz/FepE/Etk N-terminal domain-containing protein [Paenibacillus aurantius]|uniref:Wzz/FepE/Etk N-terminal domain-containing protein n=1 Tax=Paenibacillus aurantius TaxID=2918900 RepID=A0AA96LB54_9BACL|nr:Wzz/FepE/Etk N-terminal domain-containing protein [Paenibacillus aurantius]WNQ10431.1 Wzz/FepE/Etk N-terminal domain-containing protein [Paenibacillus aurantius]